ncbi:SAM-dependent methyltransferase [Streptomyces armeniacus]|uniref:SAM-dependent methyltransferase n=1 Tax=Streptomyces armeniacus TaxID=83291 RepID=A0A345XSX7_9ACTN|nr:SAM-dependent methyltransferase [Streptomyces armeniacus]AXK34743.1 SAM-dependent methyltransferase [Streptomyces armeniacus]
MVQVDTTVPHSARMYDYVLGGKDNYPPDWEAAEEALKVWPGLWTSMRVNRAVMRRMAHWLADECGVRQFLDIGTGIPTSPNLHEVVQGVAPESRVVYVDNDPIVLVHARALMAGTEEGRTAYVEADMRDPEVLFAAPELRETLDLSRPVGVTVIAMLQFVEDAAGLIERLTAPLPSGSYLAVTAATADLAQGSTALAEVYNRRGVPMYLRSRGELEALFADRCELVEPGVVPMQHWRPEEGETPVGVEQANMFAGVGRLR